MSPWLFKKCPWLAIVLNYKLGFFLVLLSLTVLLTLVPILASVSSFYDYQFDMKTGLIPDVKVVFPSSVGKASLAELHKELSSACGVERVYLGYQKTFAGATFTSIDGVSLPKDVEVFALVFNGGTSVQVLQDGQIFQCTVGRIEEFGDWSLEVGKVTGLVEGQGWLLCDQQAIPVEVFYSDGATWLNYSGEAGTEGTRCFQAFLRGLIERFADPKKSGIAFDRFSSYEDGGASDFDRFEKRSLCAFAELIFPGEKGGVPMLVSESIMKDVSNYGIGGTAVLNYGNSAYDVRIIDSFNFEPDFHLNKNLVLVNAKSLGSELLKSEFTPVSYLYFRDNADSKKLARVIKANNPECEIYEKGQVIPVVFEQYKYLSMAKTLLILFILIMMLVICVVKLLNFYTKNNDGIILLCIYGFRKAIFSKMLVVIMLIGIGLAIAILEIIFHKNNSYLNYYFYPSIQYSKQSLVFLVTYMAFVVALVSFVEGRLISSLGLQKRGNA